MVTLINDLRETQQLLASHTCSSWGWFSSHLAALGQPLYLSRHALVISHPVSHSVHNWLSVTATILLHFHHTTCIHNITVCSSLIVFRAHVHTSQGTLRNPTFYISKFAGWVDRLQTIAVPEPLLGPLRHRYLTIDNIVHYYLWFNYVQR